MRPPKFHFLSLQNSKRNQKRHRILNLHYGLSSYQPTSTDNSALMGRIGWAGWLVAQKAIVQIQNFMPFLFYYFGGLESEIWKDTFF